MDGLNDKYAQRRCLTLQRLIAENKNLDINTKLFCVNNFFNRIPYQSDMKSWGREDYWAAPLETVVKGRADCEDYAIAKFYTLIEMGIPQEKLFLIYLKRQDTLAPHFVLAYYESETAEPLILDNRNTDITSCRLGEDLIPVYRFNLKTFIGYYEGRERTLPLAQVKFKKWHELNRRMQHL